MSVRPIAVPECAEHVRNMCVKASTHRYCTTRGGEGTTHIVAGIECSRHLYSVLRRYRTIQWSSHTTFKSCGKAISCAFSILDYFHTVNGSSQQHNRLLAISRVFHASKNGESHRSTHPDCRKPLLHCTVHISQIEGRHFLLTFPSSGAEISLDKPFKLPFGFVNAVGLRCASYHHRHHHHHHKSACSSPALHYQDFAAATQH